MRGDRKYDDVGGSLKNGFSLVNSIRICIDTNLIVNTISQCFLMMICWQGFVVLNGKCFSAAWKLTWDVWNVLLDGKRFSVV